MSAPKFAEMNGVSHPRVNGVNSFHGIPTELRERKQWVNWRYEPNPDNPEKPKKVPYSNGKRVDITDSSKLVSFDDAVSAVSQYDGIGFSLLESDPFAMIDLDDPKGNVELAKRQEAIASAFASYSEISPSGKGLRIVVKGRVPSGRKNGSIEVYSSARYMTMTGNVYVNLPIQERQQLLTQLWEELCANGSQKPKLGPIESCPQLYADEEIYNRALNASNGAKFKALWEGQWQQLGYPSQSEADQALMNFLAFHSNNSDQCKRLFMTSQLGKRLVNGSKKKHKNYVDDMILKALGRTLPSVDTSAITKQVQEAVRQAKESKVGGTGSSNVGSNTRQLVGRCLAGVKMESISWLWKGWIPRKYIALVAGESGAGKGTMLCDVMARVTTGMPWPGENESRKPGRVLLLSSEDGAEDLIVPRLTACNADLGRVIQIQSASENGQRASFSMQDDLQSIGQWLEHARSEGNPFTMLVIDPVTSYLPGKKLRKVDANDAGQLRGILEPWFEIAKEFDIAIVLVTHFNKGEGMSILHRVIGSAAFVQTCRSLVSVVSLKDEEGEESFEKAMVQVKSNLPDHPGAAWKFETTKVQVGIDENNGQPVSATIPTWLELDGSITPASLTAKSSGRKPAVDVGAGFSIWLHDWFLHLDQDKALPINQVMERAIALKVCSSKWWKENSKNYLHKFNVSGIWMCRPIQQATSKQLQFDNGQGSTTLQ